MTDQVLAVLEGARGLVDLGWTRRAYARDASGKAVDADYKSAVCWCAYGAVEHEAIKVSKGGFAHLILGAIEIVRRSQNIYHLAFHEWNDAPTQTKEGVLAGFDAAIALRKAEIA